MRNLAIFVVTRTGSWIAAVFIATPALLAGGGMALAQSSGTGRDPHVLDLTDLVVALINLALPLVAAVATFLINQKVHNQQMATLLSNAVQNGVGIVQKELDQAATNDTALKAGVDYIKKNAEEAVAHFNVPDDRLESKLIAKLRLA